MKKLILTLFAISTIFMFSSCGDDGPKKIEQQFTGSTLHTQELKAYENAIITIPVKDATLDDLLKGSTGYGAPIVKCVLSIPNCEVGISGLKQGIVLKNFKLSMGEPNKGGISKDFGDIQAVGDGTIGLITNETLSFFQQVFERISKDKKIEKMSVTFTPSAQLKPEDEVKLEIFLKGTYTYMKVVE